MNKDEIKSRFRFILRQMDGGKIPKKVPLTPELISNIDEAAAQTFYNEVLQELGIKLDELI